MPDIFTIGYEGLVQSQLIDLVRAAGISHVLDIRAVASSRKAGFSKTILGTSLNAAGIAYRHDPRLGTPKPGRQAARAHRTDEMLAIFTAHMATDPAAAGLACAVQQARADATCLLCFERLAHDCHRSIVANLMRDLTGQVIRHL